MKLSCVDLIAPGSNLNQKFENLEKYGFEGIEIWLMEGEDLKAKAKETNEFAASSKVKPSTVTVTGVAAVQPLISRDAAEARSQLIKESLSIAADIDAIAFTAIEEGPQSVAPIFEAPTPTEYERKLLIDLVKDVGEYAKNVGAILALEPVNRYETHFFNTLKGATDICEEAGVENVKIMADVCEMNIEEKSITDSIERASEYIYHVHLSDNNRLLPGNGHINFNSIFGSLKKIGYKRYMALECAIPGKPEEELPKCMNYLKTCML